jgi:hypothetical protein
MRNRLLIAGGKLFVVVLVVALVWTRGPGQLAISLGLVPSSRAAGSATSARGPFVSAAANVDADSKYAGGHGGGTTFYDVWSELALKSASGERRELPLQFAETPYSTGNGFYDVMFARYRLRFSDDGQRLAISPDGRHWNVAFFNGTAAPLFCRHILIEASEREVWSRMPEPRTIVLDFLLGLAPDAPLHLHGRTDEWMSRDYPWSTRNGDDPSELDGVVAWLAAHPEATEAQRANLETLLTLPDDAYLDPLPGRFEVASAFVATHPELRADLRATVARGSATSSAEARNAGRVLLGAKDEGLPAAIVTALTRMLAAPDDAWASGPNVVSKTWGLNDLVWQLGAFRNGAAPSKDEVDLLLALLARDAKERTGMLNAQIHAIRILAASKDPRVTPRLEALAAEPPSAELPIWPTAWKGPVRDQGDFTNLGDWARLALQQRR